MTTKGDTNSKNFFGRELVPEEVEIELLQICKKYQRDRVASLVSVIVNGFNPCALGCPTVGKRRDGSLWIVDGQQRVESMRGLGHTRVLCLVFRSRGVADEAEVFRIINRDRKKVNKNREFIAGLAAGDEECYEIKKAVEGAGFCLELDGKMQSDVTTIRSASTLIQLYKKGKTSKIPNLIEMVLSTAKAAWGDDKAGFENLPLVGLAYFYAEHPKVRTSRLITCLRKADIEALKLGMSPRAHKYTRFAWNLMIEYNKNLREKSRLDLPRMKG